MTRSLTHVSCLPAAKAAVVAVAATLCFAPAKAATSEWAVNEGGRMRLVVLPADSDGKRAAALQIEPSAGWITYWREPGDAGIPPTISLAPESGYTLSEVAFPVPKRIDNGDMRDIGYDKAVTLPLTLSRSAGSAPADELKASVFIGLCKNICIPFQAEFQLSLELSDAALAEEAALVTSARKALPEHPSPDFSVRQHALNADATSLSVTLTLPEGVAKEEPEIIVTGPSGRVFLDQSERQLSGRELTVAVPIKGLPRNYDIHGKSWGILVKAGGRAMETTLAFD